MNEAGDSRLSGDGFLYARCFVIAKGQEYYSTVLRTPGEMPKTSDNWAESLLYVSSRAWSEVTGNEEEDYAGETSVSYETGSNKSQWE